MFIKIHPIETQEIKQYIKLSNIIFINDNFLLKNNLTLYDMLPYTDILLSDYSSIILDYLLLKKPIFAVSNKEIKYDRNIDNEIYQDIFNPKNTITNFQKLNKLFKNELDIEIPKKNIVKKYHKFNSGSSKKIIQYLEL